MKNPLAKYNFTDDHGHPIENCREYQDIINKRDHAKVLQDLYDSEINCSMSSFWDGGYEFKLGDHTNGYSATETFHIFAEGVDWLVSQAIIRYPESDFAKLYR